MANWNILGVWITFVGAITAGSLLIQEMNIFQMLLFGINSFGFIFFLQEYIGGKK